MVARKGTKEASKIPQLSSSRKRGTTAERVPGRGGRWTNRTCSIASEISALVAEQAFAALKAPIVRLARADAPVAYSPPLEAYVTPIAAKIVAAVKSVMR